MARISQETIEQVATASDIVEIIGSYFPLKRAGTEFRALCPFHQEKTPSFHVSPAKQSFYCFGCGAGGAVFQFLMQYEHIDFGEAVRRLAARAGITIVERELSAAEEEQTRLRGRLLRIHQEAAQWFHFQLLRTRAAESARNYMKERGLNIGVAKRWQIGYAPASWNNLYHWALGAGFNGTELLESGLVQAKEGESKSSGRYFDRFRDRLMFPICNDLGEVIAFSGRTLQKDPRAGKYMNSPETVLFTKGKTLYGLHKSKRAIANARCAIILEGQVDLISAFESGVENVVAPQGTALTEQHAHLLRRFAEEVVLFFDADAAGQKAADRALELLLSVNLQVKVGQLPPGEDPDSLIRRSGPSAFRECLDRARDFFDFSVSSPAGGTEIRTTAARVALARKVAHFAGIIADPVIRETVISRLATRLTLSRDTIETMARPNVRFRDGPAAADAAPARPLPSERIAVLCQAALSDRDLLTWLRSTPWQKILEHVPGADLLGTVLESGIDPESASALASFLAALPGEQAAVLASLLSRKPVRADIARQWWVELASVEIRRRRRQLESTQRLAHEEPSILGQARIELQEVVDLENRIAEISRLLSRV